MHTFVRKSFTSLCPCSLQWVPLGCGGIRPDKSRNEFAEDGDSTSARPEFAGYLGTVILNDQPILGFRPGCNFNGSATTLYRISDTTIPTASTGLTVGITNQGNAPRQTT